LCYHFVKRGLGLLLNFVNSSIGYQGVSFENRSYGVVSSIAIRRNKGGINMKSRLYLCLLVASVCVLTAGHPAMASSLIETAARGDTEKVQALLAQGADVNTRDNTGGTVLLQTAWDGRTDAVRLLLEKGADVNAKDNRGGTALMAAKREGHEEIVRILKEAGAKE
jgi:hypothetical protein